MLAAVAVFGLGLVVAPSPAGAQGPAPEWTGGYVPPKGPEYMGTFPTGGGQASQHPEAATLADQAVTGRADGACNITAGTKNNLNALPWATFPQQLGLTMWIQCHQWTPGPAPLGLNLAMPLGGNNRFASVILLDCQTDSQFCNGSTSTFGPTDSSFRRSAFTCLVSERASVPATAGMGGTLWSVVYACDTDQISADTTGYGHAGCTTFTSTNSMIWPSYGPIAQGQENADCSSRVPASQWAAHPNFGAYSQCNQGGGNVGTCRAGFSVHLETLEWCPAGGCEPSIGLPAYYPDVLPPGVIPGLTRDVQFGAPLPPGLCRVASFAVFDADTGAPVVTSSGFNNETTFDGLSGRTYRFDVTVTSVGGGPIENETDVVVVYSGGNELNFDDDYETNRLELDPIPAGTSPPVTRSGVSEPWPKDSLASIAVASCIDTVTGDYDNWKVGDSGATADDLFDGAMGDITECFDQYSGEGGWLAAVGSALNPKNFVEASACLLRWAFVPSVEFGGLMTRFRSYMLVSPMGTPATLVSTLRTSLSAATGDGGNCHGPGVDLAGERVYFLEACEGGMADAATFVRLALAGSLYLGGVLMGISLVARSFGWDLPWRGDPEPQQLSFDWAGRAK